MYCCFSRPLHQWISPLALTPNILTLDSAFCPLLSHPCTHSTASLLTIVDSVVNDRFRATPHALTPVSANRDGPLIGIGQCRCGSGSRLLFVRQEWSGSVQTFVRLQVVDHLRRSRAGALTPLQGSSLLSRSEIDSAFPGVAGGCCWSLVRPRFGKG